MALKSFGGYALVPSNTPDWTTATSVLLDAADEAIGFVFQAQKTATVRKIGFTLGTVTTGATLLARLETVDTSNGNPSGTLVGTNTSASVVVADTDDNVMKLATLDADASITAGSYYAFVVKNPSSSFGNLSVVANWRAPAATTWCGPPYGKQYLGSPPSSWAGFSNNYGGLCLYIEYSDGTTDPWGWYPAAATSNVSVGTAAGAREAGLYFSLPFKASISGARMTFNRNTTDGQVILYDSSTTALATVDIDKDVVGGNSYGTSWVSFSSPVTLSANTVYRLALKSNTSTTWTVYTHTFLSTDVMRSLDLGTNACWTQRDSTGAWAETTTRLPFIQLLLSQFDDGAGGGGPVGSMMVAGGGSVSVGAV